jgi:hypothetical protein
MTKLPTSDLMDGSAPNGAFAVETPETCVLAREGSRTLFV